MPPQRLKQWQISEPMLVETLAGLLGTGAQVPQAEEARRWRVGTLQGAKGGTQALVLDFTPPLALCAGGYSIPLVEVLDLENGRLVVDRNAITSMVDRAAAESTRDSGRHSATARREAHKLATQAMYKDWRKAYRALKRRQPDKTDVWCANQIAKQPIAKGRHRDTIRKHMKP